MSSESQAVGIHCNGCGRITSHDLLYSQDYPWIEEEDGHPVVLAKGARELLQCRGCQSMTLREWQAGSALFGREETYSPPRISRRPPDWLSRIPDNESYQLMREVYAALSADSRRLATMGCRAVLNRMMVEAVGDGRFDEMLDRMAKAGHLSKSQHDTLLAALEVGHAASHRGFQPSAADLGRVVSIVEYLIQATLMPDEAEELRKRTPPRPPRKKN